MMNGLPEASILLGDASLVKENEYDIILANINRNVLLNDMRAYNNGLRASGKLLLSGFYQKDLEAIRNSTMECGLYFTGSGYLNDWAVVLLHKQDQ
jgi:ribosomal protein L11 methyltransferase